MHATSFEIFSKWSCQSLRSPLRQRCLGSTLFGNSGLFLGKLRSNTELDRDSRWRNICWSAEKIRSQIFVWRSAFRASGALARYSPADSVRHHQSTVSDSPDRPSSLRQIAWGSCGLRGNAIRNFREAKTRLTRVFSIFANTTGKPYEN